MKQQQFQLEVVSIRLKKDAPILSDHKIQSAEDAIDVVGGMLCELDREVICVINLKNDGTPINCNIASMGTINYSIAHPRELFKSSILSNAVNMILVHNHPSGGNLYPSKEDITLTDQMARLSKMIGIPLLDHIIVAGDNEKYFSFREKGILPNPCILYHTEYKEIDLKSTVSERR